MNGDHFTLTISQSTTDAGDFAIHMKEPDQPEQLLVHICFPSIPMFTESYMDDVVGGIARTVAKRVIEWRVAPEEPDENLAYQEEARAVIQEALDRIRKNNQQ